MMRLLALVLVVKPVAILQRFASSSRDFRGESEKGPMRIRKPRWAEQKTGRLAGALLPAQLNNSECVPVRMY